MQNGVVPTSHCALRVRACGIDFGFIFTLTQHNLDELDWVSEFALTEGASLLQIHPLEAVGNAQQHLHGKTPDSKESAYAWLLGRQTENGTQGKMRVQVDLAYSDTIKQHPERVFADALLGTRGEMFSELVSPLVIEADGAVAPIQYGFAPHYRLGNLHQAPLCDLMSRWREERLGEFLALCRSVYDEIRSAQKPYFLNWYDVLGQTADRISTHDLLAA